MAGSVNAFSRRSLLQGSAGAASVGLLGRPALAQASAAPLRIVPHANLSSLDSLQSSALIALTAAMAIWDQLFALDSKLVPQPQMVESYTLSDDKLRWTFRLREGLLFHDGEKVRAADAIASINRWAQRDLFGRRLAALQEEIRATDDRSFEIRLKAPFPQLLYGFGATSCFVMPERVASATPASTAVTDYVGSGPFIFKSDEWVAGSQAVFIRNERYVPRQERPDMWAGGKVAKIARIEWKILPDPATAIAALQTGEVDWLERPIADLLPTLRGRRDIKVEALDPFGFWSQIRLNVSAPPFNNPTLARALLPAIQQADYMQALVGDDPALFRDKVGFFLPGSPAASDVGMEALTGPRSIERARQLVKESGYKGEPVIQMAATDLASAAAMSPVAAQMMRDIGLNVDYQSMDWGSLLSRALASNAAERGTWHAYTVAWGGMWITNPISHIHLYGTSPNPKMEALRDAWFAAPDAGEQAAITRQMQALAFQEPPVIPIGQYFVPNAYNTKLTGIVPSPVSLFWNVEKTS